MKKNLKRVISSLYSIALAIILLLMVSFIESMKYGETIILGMLVLIFIAVVILSLFSTSFKKIGISSIAEIMMAFGFLCFLSGALICLWGEAIPQSVRFPLNGVKGIVKSNEGLIVVGLQPYSRIQIYDSEGNFIKSKFINAYAGPFRLYCDEKGRINVLTEKRKWHYILSDRGDIVSKEQNKEENNYTESDLNSNSFTDQTGMTYHISNQCFYPSILKKNNTGESTIISQPLYLWISGYPFPACLLIAAGVLIMIIKDKIRNNRSIKEKRIHREKIQ